MILGMPGLLISHLDLINPGRAGTGPLGVLAFSCRSSLPLVFDLLYGPAGELWRRALPGPAIRVYRLARGDLAKGVG